MIQTYRFVVIARLEIGSNIIIGVDSYFLPMYKETEGVKDVDFKIEFYNEQYVFSNPRLTIINNTQAVFNIWQIFVNRVDGTNTAVHNTMQ